jgi:hypothetical protein
MEDSNTAELESTVFFGNSAGYRGAGLNIDYYVQVRHVHVSVSHL